MGKGKPELWDSKNDWERQLCLPGFNVEMELTEREPPYLKGLGRQEGRHVSDRPCGSMTEDQTE